MAEYIGYAVIALGGLFLLGTFFGGFFTVDQNEVAIIERFGRFVGTANAGLNFKIPYIDSVQTLDLRVQQANMEVETKTKDNVFVNFHISVQYAVSDAFKALYKLENPKNQIAAYVFDVVRAQVPKLTLDDSFEHKDDIARAVQEQLALVMDEFGYRIVKALVTGIDPDAKVKAAMNEINAASRMREAATQTGEANKIILVKKAEAEAEAKALQGKGVADQRSAILNGLRENVHDMSEATGTDAHSVMSLILMTQYFDTLKAMGEEGNTTTILLPHSPGAVGDLQTQILTALQANKASTPKT